VCETALQCLGGYGYTKNYPIEQYLRDVKIMSLYEGTNGIQALDLLGRKMRVGNGAPFAAYRIELESFCRQHDNHPSLNQKIRHLARTGKRLFEVAIEMSDRMKSDPLQWASYTYEALLCFGEITLAWRLLDMAVIAQKIIDNRKESPFHWGKVIQASYYVDVTLPLTLARLETCLRIDREIIEMPKEAF
jgi:hypothetical protein